MADVVGVVDAAVIVEIVEIVETEVDEAAAEVVDEVVIAIVMEAEAEAEADGVVKVTEGVEVVAVAVEGATGRM